MVTVMVTVRHGERPGTVNGQARWTVRHGERYAMIILYKINGLKRLQNHVHASKTKESLYNFQTITNYIHKRSKALTKWSKTLIKRWGTVRNGEERWGTVRNGEERWGTVRNGEERWGTVRNGEERWGTVRNGEER
jgi:hypothetical protein